MAIPNRHPHSAVGLAEALQVCATLGVPDGQRAQWLAESLGVAWNFAADLPTQAPTPALSPEGRSEYSTGNDSLPEMKKLKLISPVGYEPTTFEQVFAANTDRIRRAAELAPAKFSANTPRPPLPPLLVDRWFQGIMSAMLATQIPTPEIDLRQLMRDTIQGEAFLAYPFKSRPSLMRGVHLLLDRSESMQPFWRDQAELLQRLRRLLGGTLVQNSWFEYEPLRPTRMRIHWRTPLPTQFREKAPVLLITDFGAGIEPLAAQSLEWEPWLPVFQMAQASHSRILALITSLPTSWPRSIARFISGALLWDRETSPQDATRQCQR